MQQVSEPPLSRFKGFGFACNGGGKLFQVYVNAHGPQHTGQRIIRIAEMREIVLNPSGRRIPVPDQRIGNSVVKLRINLIFECPHRPGDLHRIHSCRYVLDVLYPFAYHLNPAGFIPAQIQLFHLIPIVFKEPLPLGFVLMNRCEIVIYDALRFVLVGDNIPQISLHGFPLVLESGLLVLPHIDVGGCKLGILFEVFKALGLILPDGLHGLFKFLLPFHRAHDPLKGIFIPQSLGCLFGGDLSSLQNVHPFLLLFAQVIIPVRLRLILGRFPIGFPQPVFQRRIILQPPVDPA